MLFSASVFSVARRHLLGILFLCGFAFFLSVFPARLFAQNCSSGVPVITEVYSSLGRNGMGCAIAGPGTRVRIVGCNLQDARVFVVPNGRPNDAVEQTSIVSRNFSEIQLDMGSTPDNSMIEVRRYTSPTSYISDSRCFVGVGAPSAPEVYDFEPKEAPAGRTTLVYIYGSQFSSGIDVSINGQSQNIVYRAQSIDIEANPPRNLDTLVISVSNCVEGLIVVRNTRSNRSGSSSVPLRCIAPSVPAPLITDFSPRRGGIGTQVTITGTNLQNVTQVRVGRVDAVIGVREPNRLVVTVGRGSTGQIELSSPGGTGISSQEFTFVPAPVINDISPTMIGPGTPVIIYGAHLHEASVYFGAFPDASVRPTVVSVSPDGTQLTAIIGTIGTITAVYPLLPAFRVPVQVSTPGGIRTASQQVQFVADTFRLPVLSLRPANARNGAKISGDTLILRERVASYFPVPEAAGGEILIERRGWNSSLNVLVNLTYRSSAGTVITLINGAFVNDLTLSQDDRKIIPLPIPPSARGENLQLLPNFPARSEEAVDGGTINGLRGDLGASARTRGANLMVQGQNAIPISALDFFSVYDSASMTFRARWSDQSYRTNPENMPQSPALQGRRTLTIEILPPLVPGTYTVSPNNQTAFVVLDDPDPTHSLRVINPIDNKMIAPGANDAINLESPGNMPNVRNNGNLLSNAVFLDETYSLLQYTAHTSDTSLIRNLRIDRQQAGAFPYLSYQLAPTARSGSSAMITVTASNGRGGSTTNTFVVSVLQGAPIIDRIEPNAAAPGAEVRIIGRDLANLRFVNFSGVGGIGVPAEILSTSADVIVVRVPDAAQTGAITISTRVAESQTQVFTVIRTPQIQSFSPDSARTGSSIIIRGVNFSGITSLRFGGVDALDFTVLADTLITARVRNGASGIISISNGRENVVSSAVFTLIPPPIITSLSPQVGGAGETITLTGENFSGAGFTRPDSVILNNRAVSFTVVNSSRLSFVVPDFGTDLLENLTLRLVTRGGSTTATTRFTFTPCPRLERFSPQSAGPLDSISLVGSNLSGVTAVHIGGMPVQGFRIVSPSEIRAAVGSVVSGRIAVITPICSDSSATSFTYLAPQNTLYMTTPTFGKVFPNETTTATLTLMNLSGGAMTVNLAVQEDTESNFALVNPMPPMQTIILARNQTAEIVVRFSPKTSGAKSARLVASGQGVTGAPSEVLQGRAGVWQVLPVHFDTVRIGRSTVRAARIINRNTVSSALHTVRIAGASIFTLDGTLPRWVGAGDTIAAIVRALPRSSGVLTEEIIVETQGADTGRASVTAIAREQRSTDIVAEPTFAAARDSVEAGQNIAAHMHLRITQGAQSVPVGTLQISGSFRWNRNVLLPTLNPTNDPAPEAQGSVRYARNSEPRNSILRCILPPQAPHQSWTGTNSTRLLSVPLGVYYGETNQTRMEIEELFMMNAANGSGNARVFVEEPTHTLFTAQTFGRHVRPATASSLDVVSPSPASVSANVRYTISHETAILLTLVDMHGKRIKTIAEGWRMHGVYEHTFTVDDIPSGSYYIMLHTEHDRKTASLKVIR